MKHTSSIFVSLTGAAVALAVVAAPAGALRDSGSPNSIVGSNGTSASVPAPERDHSSLNAALGARSEDGAHRRSERYTSISAILGGSSQADRGTPQFWPSQARVRSERRHASESSGPTSSRSAKPGYLSLNSIVGPVGTAPERAASVVRESSGFDWGDALVGAAAALGLAMISLATVRTLRRRRGIFAESGT